MGSRVRAAGSMLKTFGSAPLLPGSIAQTRRFVKTLAVGRDGGRLGRGAGCYDRALARVDPSTPLVAVVHDDELLDTVPTEAHDRRVTDVVTPNGGWLTLQV